MRLIDADVLIKQLQRNYVFGMVRNTEDKNVYGIINEQPTVFDVKKVVAELEKQDDDCGCGKIDVWKAIDIVKNGGI